MTQFSPPGYVRDLPDDGLLHWSNLVQKYFDAVADFKKLFSPLTLPAGQSGTSRLIPWNAFPKKYNTVVNPDPLFKYKVLENLVTKDLQQRDYSRVYSTQGGVGVTNLQFRDQDEYLEWKTFRNSDGSLNKMVFTCDHPEYWKFIGQYSPDLLLKLYNKYVDNSAKLDDLLFQNDIFEKLDDGSVVNRKGQYNPFNKWNTTDGILHLTHPANYLSAEIQLAADATILRTDANGHLITDPDKLIRCAQYGNPLRSSDPKIGSDVNTLVRSDLSVTISDPVALYIHDINESNFEFPKGYDISDFWKVIRGDSAKKMILRAEFSPPAGTSIAMEQIKVNGRTLQFGGQIADTLTMAIYGLGYHFPDTGKPTTQGCEAAVQDLELILKKSPQKLHSRS